METKGPERPNGGNFLYIQVGAYLLKVMLFNFFLISGKVLEPLPLLRIYIKQEFTCDWSKLKHIFFSINAFLPGKLLRQKDVIVLTKYLQAGAAGCNRCLMTQLHFRAVKNFPSQSQAAPWSDSTNEINVPRIRTNLRRGIYD